MTVESRSKMNYSIIEEHIRNVIKFYQFNIIHFKTKQPHVHILSRRAVKNLRKLENEFNIVFQKYNYLFGKYQPIIAKSLIRIINKDLKHTTKSTDFPYNIKLPSLSM